MTKFAREYVLHTIKDGETKTLSEEYYEFTEHRGWVLVPNSVGEKWNSKTVDYRQIVHDTIPKRRRDGSVGRNKMILAYDAGNISQPSEHKYEDDNGPLTDKQIDAIRATSSATNIQDEDFDDGPLIA